MARSSTPETLRIVDQRGRWLATVTRRAYTVLMPGPARTFKEPGVGPVVTHSFWVRTLPAPLSGQPDQDWLTYARTANQRRYPDLLALAMQYVSGASAVLDGELQIAGDASYGPLVDGKREEGADFNDYLGVEWDYPDRVDAPEERQFQCLDCSGYMRMIWGYRPHLPGDEYASTIPLSLRPVRNRRALPRRAFEMCESGPGVMVVPDTGDRVDDFSAMNVGDLVFFDADPDDGEQIDHVGMYLGVDSKNHHRFISSRKRADGPTMGDFAGASILDGSGLYARSFRAVRRL